jgi:hypothetical protein
MNPRLPTPSSAPGYTYDLYVLRVPSKRCVVRFGASATGSDGSPLRLTLVRRFWNCVESINNLRSTAIPIYCDTAITALPILSDWPFFCACINVCMCAKNYRNTKKLSFYHFTYSEINSYFLIMLEGRLVHICKYKHTAYVPYFFYFVEKC